jgi:NADPH:quinone reductase-like Zn-dependent oxidoreductase
MAATETAKRTTMKAAARSTYGPPDVIELREVAMPTLTDERVLVRVRASSVNRADWYTLRGRPVVGRAQMGFLKPKSPLLGVDFAGVVEAVGKDVTRFRPGDEVFGGRDGAFAEYVAAREAATAAKPANVSFEEAATVPIAGLTALQGLRDKASVQAGQEVLINGASGGVGTFAVQIAKALGARVTGVCSTRNVELVESLGADEVVDYTRADFTRSAKRYDVLLDVAGTRSLRECSRVLKPDATVVVIGAPMNGGPVGPLGHVAGMWLAGRTSSRSVRFFVAKFLAADLEYLAGLLESGRVTPFVERRCELSEVADALRYQGEGHSRGKVVVTI